MERGIRFLGQSYAAVETGQREMSSLSLTFKTLSPSGVLVYSGEVTWFLLFYICQKSSLSQDLKQWNYFWSVHVIVPQRTTDYMRDE